MKGPGVAGLLTALGAVIVSFCVGVGASWAQGSTPDIVFGPGPVVFGSAFSGLGSAGNTPTLTVTNQTLAPGQTTDVGIGVGPWVPGDNVHLWMVLTQDGSTPQEIGPTSIIADPSGGFTDVPVTIPGGSGPGSYVIFAISQGSNGTAVVTQNVAVESAGSVASADAVGPPDVTWQPPATWSDPTTRSIVGAAVDKAAAAVQPGTDAAPAPPVRQASSRDALSRTHQHSSGNALLISALVALLFASLVATLWLRRRHWTGHA